jgi:luciferase family oxidoreductase group 1
MPAPADVCSMKLSLIDLSVVPQTGNRHQAILNTLDMAQKADEWGFNRIWLAEHHATGAMAGRTPEVMIPYIAAATKRIRVGSGSVLLNHYSPFKVAESFATLEDMFPGRIDMGIGRATTGPVSDVALQRNRSYRQTTDDSAEQLAELVAWMENDFPKGHAFSQIRVHRNDTVPPLWLLGSSAWSAGAAAQLGLRYSFAGFINPAQSWQIAESYRQNFKSAAGLTGIEQPELILSLSVYCADTEEKAARLAAPVQLMFKRMMSGDVQSRMEDEDTAIDLLGGLPEPEKLTDPRQPPRILAGTPDTLYQALNEIAEAYQCSEIMLQCITPDHQARLRSHQLLAERFELLK